jgi:hypothetical protein
MGSSKQVLSNKSLVSFKKMIQVILKSSRKTIYTFLNSAKFKSWNLKDQISYVLFEKKLF